MMLPHEIAELIEAFAVDVERLPGVSRTNPHVFGERKSELVHAMRVKAKSFRTVRRVAVAVPGAIVPGTIIVGRRAIRVERRRA